MMIKIKNDNNDNNDNNDDNDNLTGTGETKRAYSTDKTTGQ